MNSQTHMRADARANRAKLIKSARHLFSERGLDVDVREICEHAGVGMGTLYRNFSTKEALIEAVQDDVRAALSEMMDSAEGRAAEIGMESLVDTFLKLSERLGRIGGVLSQRMRAQSGVEAPEWATSLRQRGTDSWREFQRAGVARDDIPAEFQREVFDRILDVYQGLRHHWSAEDTQRWLGAILTDGVRARTED